MRPKRDQITPREDRVPGGADRPSGPGNLRAGGIEESVETPSPTGGRDALEGALAPAGGEAEGR